MKIIGVRKQLTNRIDSVCVSIVCVVVSENTVYLYSVLVNLVDKSSAYLRESIKVHELSAIKEISKMQNRCDVVLFTVRKKLFFKKLE